MLIRTTMDLNEFGCLHFERISPRIAQTGGEFL